MDSSLSVEQMHAKLNQSKPFGSPIATTTTTTSSNSDDHDVNTEFVLEVIPKYVRLARLSEQFAFDQISSIIVRQLSVVLYLVTYDVRRLSCCCTTRVTELWRMHYEK